MKSKYILLVAVCFLLFSGCSLKEKEVGYNQGIYNGSATDTYGGQENIATATVTVDENGKITDVYLDTTYTTEDGKATTKKTLKEDYGMYGSAYGSNVGEWYQQVEALENYVVENQGLGNIILNDEGKTDAVSGCTIKIDALYEALDQALESAKK